MKIKSLLFYRTKQQRGLAPKGSAPLNMIKNASRGEIAVSEEIEYNDQMMVRREKVARMQQEGKDPFGERFDSHTYGGVGSYRI